MAAIAKGKGERADATTIRNEVAADFAASDTELAETINTLGRAISVLSREMAKNPAPVAQIDGKGKINGAIQATSAFLDAASFPSKDQAKLLAFLQSQQADESDDLDVGALARAVYKTQSGGILDLKEKAETKLSDLCKAEVNTRHNFER